MDASSPSPEHRVNPRRKVHGCIGASIALGLCATGLVASASRAVDTPAVPFGSHQSSYGAGTILPSTPAASMDADTKAFYLKWKSKYLVSACGSGLAVTSPDADHPFVAEAQGYGLEILALMAGADSEARANFDGVLKFILAHPSSINAGLLAAEQDSSCRSVNGSDSATDGDIAVAYGLLLADRQWGSNGTYDYRALATTRINAIKSSEINPTTKLPLLGDWSSPGDKYYTSTRPSDFMIDHFRAFKAATGDTLWDQVIAATSGLLTQQQAAYAPATGLIADFVVDTNSTPKPAPANFLEGSSDGQYSYNSVRVPWHIGTDAIVNADSASKAQSQTITDWIKTKVANDPSKVRSGYRLTGTSTESYLDPEFVATFGPAAMANTGNQVWLDAIWAYTTSASKTNSGIASYYGSSLILQNMIVMSGNYWAPNSLPVVNPSATASSPAIPTPAPTTPTISPAPTPTPTPSPTATTPPTTPAMRLTVTFKYTDTWSRGYCGSLVVRNDTSAKVNQFTIGFDLPGNISLSDKWNGTFIRSGTRFSVRSNSGQSIATGRSNSSIGFCVDRLSNAQRSISAPTNLTASAV